MFRYADEHSDVRWTPVRELSGVQGVCVQAALDNEGQLHTQVF